MHQDRTKSRGLDQPSDFRRHYTIGIKIFPPSLKNLSAVVIYASQTGRAKSGSYARAGHYLITVPRVPCNPATKRGSFFTSILGPRGIRFLRCF